MMEARPDVSVAKGRPPLEEERLQFATGTSLGDLPAAKVDELEVGFIRLVGSARIADLLTIATIVTAALIYFLL
jgi:hypothetical protein